MTATEATETRFGVRSMTAPLRRALLVEPAAGDFTGAGWTAEPDLDRLRRDHAALVELRMAKPARANEPPFLARALADAGVQRIGGLSGDAVSDGGDMLWLDEQTLGVARGYRTNKAAHEQLGELLAPEGVQVERVDLA